MKIVRSRYISDAEVAYLRHALRLGNNTKAIKRTLQRLCTHYESGKKLEDASDIRALLHSHLGSSEILLRRWSMKAIGLIGNRDDTSRLVDRLRVENDLEAQTWGTAALLKNARDRGVEQICAEAGLESSIPLALAARLYAPDRWIDSYWKPVVLSLNDDDLTLKWAIFLIGYDRAPEALFNPRHPNNVFLGELNNHDTQEISEYSIWALWERKDCGASDLKVRPDDFSKHPENARKWLYRIGLQSPDNLLIDPDRLEEFRLIEPSISAREGLAIGLSDLKDSRFDEQTLNWYDDESEPLIKETLLAGMAAKSDNHGEFASLVERKFRDASPTDSIRPRLLAAAEGTALYRKLLRKQFEEEAQRQGILEISAGLTLINNGVLTLAGSNFNVGGNLNAGNLVAGDVIGSALSSVKNIAPERAHDREILSEILDFLKRKDIPQENQNDISSAVSDVANTPSEATKRNLLSKLKGLGGLLGATAALSDIIEKVQDWIG